MPGKGSFRTSSVVSLVNETSKRELTIFIFISLQLDTNGQPKKETMNSDGFRKLWQVPGVARVTVKDDALTRKAIDKALERQANNSYDLHETEQRISDEETKISDLRDQIERSELYFKSYL